MANYDLSRLNILLADDCAFALRTLANVLRILRVGKIYQARDGGEAIEIMKESVKESAVRGKSNIDLIISDWLMEPVNGEMFLRWIRRSNESPDRYMPFIAMSGLVDEQTIASAREAGVNEFIAKPYSITTIANRLIGVIDNPRQFVFDGTYFGPDRRRKSLDINFEDRRKTNPANVEVVYAGKKIESLDAKSKIWYFRLPNTLKGKFSSDGSGIGSISPELLEAAEAQLDTMEDDYSDWVKNSVKAMIEQYEKLKENPVNPWRHLKFISKNALHLKGQGETFGYKLITQFGKSLYETTSDVKNISDNLLEFIKAHFDAIHLVLRDKIRGSGGRTGDELLVMLEKAREKYRKPPAPQLEAPKK